MPALTRDARATARAPLLLIGFLVLAGCMTTPPPVDHADDASVAPSWDALGAAIFHAAHDHFDRELHTPIAEGLRVENASTLNPDGTSLGLYTEADAARNLYAVAVQRPSPPVLRGVLLDAEALPAVQVLGFFEEPEASGDIKLDRVAPLAYVPFPAASKGRSFAIWDVQDPAQPRKLGEAPGGGCHMLHPMRSGSESYVWCAGFGAPHLYRILLLPDGSARGVPLTYAFPQRDHEVARYANYHGAIGPMTLAAPHDMTVQADPLTALPLLVSAHELQGIRVFDVSTPTAPVEVSRWRGDGATTPMERIHSVGLVRLGDRRVGIGVSETFFNVPPVLYLVDFTDFAKPRFLAQWSPPGILHDGKLVYSLHNFQVAGNRLYVSAFHAGLWVLDIADPAAPTPLALRNPVRDTAYPVPGQSGKDLNQFWDVQLLRGFVVATDMPAGIEVLKVDGDDGGGLTWGTRF